ncbi:hypothetical protein [Cloacibacillus evryensis]|uniref:hypothetical protein n=1 Tax=Cloacibacillus evryensis TaxID=508460 RepID=UPI003AB8A460
MNESPRKRVWVVTRIDGGRAAAADVFDNGSDAENFAGEMSVDTNNLAGLFQVLESSLHSRDPEKYISVPESIEKLVGGLYNDLALGGGTGKAAEYLAAHKPELIDEAVRAAKERIVEILEEKGLLPK